MTHLEKLTSRIEMIVQEKCHVDIFSGSALERVLFNAMTSFLTDFIHFRFGFWRGRTHFKFCLEDNGSE